MSIVPFPPDFAPALGDLQDHLPDWWRTEDPTSQLYLFLQPIADQIDGLSELFEQPYLDQVITTASLEGLMRNFAFAWGLQNEQLPAVVPQLIAFIQELAAEDGSLQSLINALTALISSPANEGGPVLTFPSGGGGLTFPSNGTGLTMYEFAPGGGPALALTFPSDGSGLVFPADGSGLTLSSSFLINVLPDYATFQLTIQVQSWLAFDRGAFARAVERFQVADWLPTIIQEIA